MSGWRHLAIPGADVSLLPCLELGEPPDAVLAALLAETPWRQDSVKLYGRLIPQPRLAAWVGDPGCAYRYSGLTLEPLPWSAGLCDVRRRVEAATGHRFNSVLVNLYRDQNDSMGMHSDDERELGSQPVIASLSLGAERVFVLKSRLDRSAKPIRIPLASGSLLLMQGDTQATYKHGIAKTTRPLGPRVNLTFRRIVAAT